MTTCPTLWLPAGAIEHIRKECPPEWTEKRKHLEKLLFVLSRVADGQTGRVHSESGRFDGWTGYNVTAIGEIIGGTKKATEARNLLERAGLLKVRRHAFGGLSYSSGKFAAQVRLPEEWLAGEWAPEPVADLLLQRNLAGRENEEREAVLKSAGESGRYQSAAVSWVNWSLRGLSFASGVPTEPTAGGEDAEQASAGRLRTWKAAIADIEKGALWLRRDTDTGRLFHNATQMPKELRPFLLLDGKPTRELDIANAQPAFLLTEFSGIDPKERDTFAEVVADGRFYETLAAGILNSTTLAQRRFYLGQFETNRGEFKKSVFRKLLFSASRPELNALEKALAGRWPGLAHRLRAERAKPDGASKLAKRLQRAEANLIFGRVLPTLRGMNLGTDWEGDGPPLLGPGARVVTVHDSVICQARHVRTVQRVLQEQTQAVLGATLTVRAK